MIHRRIFATKCKSTASHCIYIFLVQLDGWTISTINIAPNVHSADLSSFGRGNRFDRRVQ